MAIPGVEGFELLSNLMKFFSFLISVAMKTLLLQCYLMMKFIPMMRFVNDHLSFYWICMQCLMNLVFPHHPRLKY